MCNNNRYESSVVRSSDSDLQPAVAEIRKRGIEVVYLGFEDNPNKGLTYTTNSTIFFRNNEIAKVVPARKKLINKIWSFVNVTNMAGGGQRAVYQNQGCPTGYHCADMQTIGGETSGRCIKN